MNKKQFAAAGCATFALVAWAAADRDPARPSGPTPAPAPQPVAFAANLPASTPSSPPTQVAAALPAPVMGSAPPLGAKLPDGRQRAFPTAEGFGAAATGGRGGRAIAVTTLADAGAGSLRACMMDIGPRTCIFRVGGTIELASQIKPKSGNLTIAGQTAPGDGIAIRNTPTNLTGSPIFLNAPHNIIRHVRIRPGPTSGAKQGTTDAITLDSGARNTILDHVSLSWATDEPFNSTKASGDITVQWSLVYEGLSRSTHEAGEHAKGMFIEGNGITVHHTLIAHATDRMPNAGVGNRADIVNVVSYNMREKAHQYFSMLAKASVGAASGLKREANIIGNWVSMGPSSLRGQPIFGGDYQEEFSTFPGNAAFYLQGNIDARRRSTAADERLFFDPKDWKYVVGAPIGAVVPGFTSADQAVRDIIAFAGAYPRDASDQRVSRDFLSCGGAIIDSPTQVGGWPVLASGAPYPDADGDGMDDRWEQARGWTNGPLDGDGDGYTNLEEFLNELAGDQGTDGRSINRLGTGTGPVPAINCDIPLR